MVITNTEIELIIENRINEIYNKSSYPLKEDYIINEAYIIDIIDNIKKLRILGNTIIYRSDDSPYMIRLMASKCNNIPLLILTNSYYSEYAVFGELNITFSLLANIVCFHWYKAKKYFFVSFGSNTFWPPNDFWSSILNEITKIILDNNFYIVHPKLLTKIYNIHFEGKKYSTNKPNVSTLLFDEDLIPSRIITIGCGHYLNKFHLHLGK